MRLVLIFCWRLQKQTEKLNLYKNFKATGLDNSYKVAYGVYISPMPVSKFNLQDFIVIRPLFCSYKHKVKEKSTCKDCLALVGFARYLEMECIVELSTAYKADQAVTKVMQMPVSVVQMCLQGPGLQKLFVIANVPGMDIHRFTRLAEKCLPQTLTKTVMTKAMLKDLCNLASSESDRLLIKFACCKGQNLSSNDSSKIYGFSNFTKQETKINEAISSLREVCEAVDMLATVKDKAILQGFGLTISSDEFG